jgi:hypothetical protein
MIIKLYTLDTQKTIQQHLILTCQVSHSDVALINDL